MKKGRIISREELYKLFKEGKLTFINKDDIPILKVNNDD